MEVSVLGAQNERCQQADKSGNGKPCTHKKSLSNVCCRGDVMSAPGGEKGVSSIGERYALSIDLTCKNPEKMVVVTLFGA